MSFVPRIASRSFGGLCSKMKPAPLVRAEAACSSRLFGTKRGVPGNPPGDILYYNEQRDLKNIDEKAIRNTVDQIRKCVGYETYDVTLILCDDEEMQISNAASRGVDAPTDILSFAFLDAIEPGLLEEPEFDVPDMYTLGDIMIDIPYVMRVCSDDAQYEPDPEERGVSAVLAKETDPEKRIHLLLIHGMLHLVGYDHETDEDFEEMVAEEERILKELGYE